MPRGGGGRDRSRTGTSRGAPRTAGNTGDEEKGRGLPSTPQREHGHRDCRLPASGTTREGDPVALSGPDFGSLLGPLWDLSYLRIRKRPNGFLKRREREEEEEKLGVCLSEPRCVGSVC